MELKSMELSGAPHLMGLTKALYHSAFPKEERIPWPLLRASALRRDIHLTAWLRGDSFCGMTASVDVPGMHFVLFLAIAEPMRGTGCGSAILRQLQREHPVVALNVEPLTADAPNLSQRQQRFAFYEKNGFQDTGYHVWEVGGMFRVLSTRKELDWEIYRQVFRKLTFGLWTVRLEKAE